MRFGFYHPLLTRRPFESLQNTTRNIVTRRHYEPKVTKPEKWNIFSTLNQPAVMVDGQIYFPVNQVILGRKLLTFTGKTHIQELKAGARVYGHIKGSNAELQDGTVHRGEDEQSGKLLVQFQRAAEIKHPDVTNPEELEAHARFFGYNSEAEFIEARARFKEFLRRFKANKDGVKANKLAKKRDRITRKGKASSRSKTPSRSRAAAVPPNSAMPAAPPAPSSSAPSPRPIPGVDKPLPPPSALSRETIRSHVSSPLPRTSGSSPLALAQPQGSFIKPRNQKSKVASGLQQPTFCLPPAVLLGQRPTESLSLALITRSENYNVPEKKLLISLKQETLLELITLELPALLQNAPMQLSMR